MFFKPKRIKKLEEEIDSLKDELLHYTALSIHYKELLSNETDTNEILMKTIEKLNESLKETEDRRRKAAGKIGGLTKQLNEKEKRVEELESKVKELSSGAYLRVQLKPQRVPKAEPIKIRSFAKTSNIARKHQEEIER